MTTKHAGFAAAVCLWAGAALLASGTAGAQIPAVAAGAAPAAAPVSIALGGPAAQDAGQESSFRVGRSVVRVGRDFALRAGESAGDVVAALGTVTIGGRVDRDVRVFLGDARLSSAAVIDRDLVVVGGSATIEAGAAVHGSLVVIGGTLTAPPDFGPGGEQVVVGSPVISGSVKAVLPWLTRGLAWGRPIVPGLGWVWFVVVAFFLVYLAANTLFNGPVRLAAAAALGRPLTTFLLGLLVLVVSVPALVVLAATLVGIAIVPFLLCALLLAGLAGKAGVLRAIGAALVHESSPDSRLQSFRSLLLGAAVITVVYMIPVLGMAAWAVTGVLALGAAASALRVLLAREHPRRERPAAAAPSAGEAAGNGAEVPAVPLDASASEAAPFAPAEVPAGDLTLCPRATFLDRVAAFALDCLLVAIAVMVFGAGFLGEGGFPLFLLAYHIAFWAWKGTTLGGIVVGVRVVRAQGGELRAADALVRGLSAIFSVAAVGIGCFWMLQDPKSQMWHDKIAGTLVVKVPRDTLLT